MPTSEPIDYFTSPQKLPQMKKQWRVSTFGHSGFDRNTSDFTDFYCGLHTFICERE